MREPISTGLVRHQSPHPTASRTPDPGERLVFTLVLPDGVIGAKLAAVVAFYRRNHFTPVWAGLVNDATDRDFEVLNDHLKKYAVPDCGLNPRVYAIAPALVLLLLGPDDAELPAHEAMNRLKGHSSPYLAEPGQARFALDAVNRCLRLVHAADDPGATRRDFLLFKTRAEWDEALAMARIAADPTRRGEVDARIDAVVERATRATAGFHCETDFLRILVRVKRRLAPATSMAFGEDAGAALDAIWQRQDAIAGGSEEVLERTRGVLPLLAEEARRLDAIDSAADPPLHVALARLARPATWDVHVAERVSALCRVRGVPISAWEEIVLATSLHYWEDSLPDDLRAAIRSQTRSERETHMGA